MSFHEAWAPWAFVVLALVVLGYLASMVLKSKRATPTQAAPSGMEAYTSRRQDLLLKFVTDADGKKRGETVALDGENVIVKERERFFAVPAGSLEASEAGVRVGEDVDWEKAREEGAAWRERSTKVVSYSPEELPKE